MRLQIACGVEPEGVAVGPEVTEADTGVDEQVPDDDKDRAGNRDERCQLARAAGRAPVAFAEESFGRGGGVGCSPSTPFR
ncbi:hypothetical protein [Rhodococcus koreensis]|uniref:hypothetical protein n=1 Tax=Rhodococcus koreensis TaxID=99653 RepID=UPI00093431FD|nr:hypothetical protein [Rhodococcus koreensis]